MLRGACRTRQAKFPMLLQMHLGTVGSIAMSYAPRRKTSSDSETEEDEEHSDEGAGNRQASHPFQHLMWHRSVQASAALISPSC